MAKRTIRVDVTRVPEALAAMRRELSDALREAAADEAPAVARRLRALADAFEAGQQGEE